MSFAPRGDHREVAATVGTLLRSGVMAKLTVVPGRLSARAVFMFLFLVSAVVMLGSPDRARAQDCEYGAFGCGHAEQHHQYQDWQPLNGKGNCCNGEDCRPVRARTEDDGSWSVWIPEFRRWIPVPAFAVGEPDRFGDGRSHVCSTKPMPSLPVFHIFCFSPTGSKS